MIRKALLIMATLTVPLIGAAQASDPRAVSIAGWVTAATDQIIVPAYESFASKADMLRQRTASLCVSPSPAAVKRTREAFADLVVAFGHIEPYRFGPAREENRIERLFFWPDPRSRGLRQVQAALASQDSGVTRPDSLYAKSVAMQGIPAFDFVLSGAGAEQLEGPEGAFRCRYARAVSDIIAQIGDALHHAWTKPGGYADQMRNPGAHQPLYRTMSEALGEILRAVREQTRIVVKFKLKRVLGDSPLKAKPKRAPLWRSNLSLTMLHANLASLSALVSAWPTQDLPDSEGLKRQALFESHQAINAIDAVRVASLEWTQALNDPALHARLSYAMIPLAGLERLATRDIPAKLGLIVRFNSQDGD